MIRPRSWRSEAMLSEVSGHQPGEHILVVSGHQSVEQILVGHPTARGSVQCVLVGWQTMASGSRSWKRIGQAMGLVRRDQPVAQNVAPLPSRRMARDPGQNIGPAKVIVPRAVERAWQIHLPIRATVVEHR